MTKRDVVIAGLGLVTGVVGYMLLAIYMTRRMLG